jgi:DNA-nicking Smr family endonuclease|tara:strand:- start:9 stop:422 length:414 start_codon:yes stop_codon:yes gene_type:complete
LKNKISDKDKKDWQKFIESKERVQNKDSYNNEEKKISIEKTIDLHGYSLDEANQKIKEFIEKSYLESVSKINIITGKGSRSKNKNDPYQSSDLGILKHSIPDYIKNNIELMKKIKKIDFQSINSPNLGSFYIILKKK